MKLEVDKPEVTDLVVVYSGRFQPFHAGHYVSYLKLCTKFGKDSVYIATSNSTSGNKSPFDFKEKKEIATTMFNVPSDKFIQVSNPYAPKEILQGFDGKTTAYIAAVGEKDESRLSGKYFKPYKGKTGYGYDEIGYTYAVPAESSPISGTDVRKWLGSGDDESKKKGFLKAYPKFNADIFKMITNKLNEEGFPGGIGTGLNLPGGYINGAPTGSANESNNTEPSSALRPEPHPTRHETEHPSNEPDWYNNENLYDPIGHIVDRVLAEEMFKEFVDSYFTEAPNPVMDKEFDYTSADGTKKKITVKGALRLAKDHPAHIQASKLVGSDKAAMAKGPADAPVNEPKKLPQKGKAATQSAKPSEPGQPVKQGQTQQGKADTTTGKAGTPQQGAETPQVEPQKLSGAELKSSAEKTPKDKKAEKQSKFKEFFKSATDSVKKQAEALWNDFNTEEQHHAHEMANPDSEIRKSISKTATDFISNMPTNIVKGAYEVVKHKYHQLKNTTKAAKSIAMSLSHGKGWQFGYEKGKDGKWGVNKNEAEKQKKAAKETAWDVAKIAAAVVTGGALSSVVGHVAAGGTIGGIGQAALSGAGETLSHGITGFAGHMATDFAKHCGFEAMGLGAGIDFNTANKLAARAGLTQVAVVPHMNKIFQSAMGFLGEGDTSENEEKQHADLFMNLLKTVLEKMKDFKPTPEQMFATMQSYTESKKQNAEKEKGTEVANLLKPIHEQISPLKRENISHFVEYASKRLNLKEQPNIVLVEDPEFSRQNHSLGGYNVDSKQIFVATEGRLTADILRTIAHEMVHRKQDEMGLIGDSVKDGATGSDVENKANSVAAILLREYGKLNKTIYNEDITMDVDKGDTVLMGKFKNKRTTVKDIGTDDHGMPTINGKKAATFRIPRGEEEKPNPQSVFNEVGTNDWRFKAIMKMWDTASSFGKKKIAAVVCKDPNADKNDIERELRNFGYRDITDVGDDLGLSEVTTNDWHFKAIMKLYDKANSFGKKKIGVAVCKDPNASRKDIVVQLRDTDYEEVTSMTDKLGLKEYIEKKKLSKINESINSKNHKADTTADRDFTKHHKTSMYAPDMGYPAELDTFDFDDKRKKVPGYQTNTKDTEDRGYEPVKAEKLNQSNLDSVERYADRELDPADIEFSNHFFDRVNDTRNGKEISEPELTGFFKRLSRHKKQFIDFLDKYNQIVVKDERSDINIPFVKMANKVIAKTVMRKVNFQTSSPTMVNEVKWEDTAYDKCMLGKLPLSLNIVQKLVEPIRTTSLHATDIENLPKVASLEGTKKSISTFTKTTKWGKLVQGKGMHTKGGIIVALSGVVLAQSIMDLWTEPDKQGRRWVNPGTIIAGLGREQDVVFNFAPELKKYKEEWMKNMYDKPATNQEKAEFIKKYYDAADRYMLSKKKEFQDKYLNSNGLYYDVDWNEVVLSQIKIESILVVPELLKVKTQVGSWTFDREDKDETDKIIKQLKQKYPKVVVAKDESDIANFITTNGGSIINESNDPSDIIKDLDKVRTDLIKQVEVLIAKKKKLYSNVDIESPMSADEKKLDKDIQSIFSQIQDLIQQKRKIKKPINEGGAYGHMSHPFDDMDLTFGDLKNIITGALTGKLELTREKTDGQALAISWKNGRLIAARNKGNLANAGANAMGIEDVASKFAGRGGLTDAYNFAMKDLSAAISSLSEPQRKKIFDEGKCFMNLEVIWPTSVNVIPYGQPLLVFHNTTCYDETGKAVGANQGAATMLAGMIKQVNADVQSKYTIQGPPVTKLPNNEELSSKQTKYLTQLQQLQFKFQLSNKDGVAEYHQAWWADFIDKSKVKLQKLEKESLVRRWAFGDKSFRLNTITDKDAQKWAIDNDKVNVANQQKENIRPFEEIFLGVGADVLSFMDSVLTANPNAAVASMKQRLKDTADKVRGSGDVTKIQKLKSELARLQSIGGLDKIVPNEGIVFIYKGNTYKLTGTFAPLNQILGIFYE